MKDGGRGRGGGGVSPDPQGTCKLPLIKYWKFFTFLSKSNISKVTSYFITLREHPVCCIWMKRKTFHRSNDIVMNHISSAPLFLSLCLRDQEKQCDGALHLFGFHYLMKDDPTVLGTLQNLTWGAWSNSRPLRELTEFPKRIESFSGKY